MSDGHGAGTGGAGATLAAGEEARAGAGPPAAEALRRLLAGHRPADEREAASLRRFDQELDRLARPFDEHADPTHVTASAIVVGRRGTVLHVHRRLGRWLQPGGHVDAGESPPEAAVREATEETGLALRHPAVGPALIHVDVHPAANGHLHLDLRYLLVGDDDDPAPPPGESQQVRWFTFAEAVEVADEGLATALRRAEEWMATEGGPR